MQRIFTPSKTQFDIPDFEDARADLAPYYRTSLTLKRCESEVLAELAKLNAGGHLVQGTFNTGDAKRHGYELRFYWQGGQGVIRVAGLRMRKPSASKKEQVLKQALCNLRDWLKVAVTMQIFDDSQSILMPYMLVDGNRTVADVLIASGTLPMLASGEVVEGQFTEA